jgi:hypothetical protein
VSLPSILIEKRRGAYRNLSWTDLVDVVRSRSRSPDGSATRIIAENERSRAAVGEKLA